MRAPRFTPHTAEVFGKPAIQPAFLVACSVKQKPAAAALPGPSDQNTSFMPS
jgi:hypothetical protein